MFNPEVFQGTPHKKNYFEGWYYKLTDAGRRYVLSLIPGVSTARGEPHAFIQVIDSRSAATDYIRFPIQSFAASRKELALDIGGNAFCRDKLEVDLSGANFSVSGRLSFYDIVPFPKRLLFRGIMGPFCFLPSMECNHGIANIRHSISGSLHINGQEVDFSGGTGYIEKDWGRSFPAFYVWAQASDPVKGADFMFSIADIPFLGRRFTGILCFLYLDGRYYAIATYNGARLTRFQLDDESLCVQLENKSYALSFTLRRAKGGSLKAPARGLMHRTIEETLNATASVQFGQKKGSPIFEASMSNAGMEICGDLAPVYGLLKA